MRWWFTIKLTLLLFKADVAITVRQKKRELKVLKQVSYV